MKNITTVSNSIIREFAENVFKNRGKIDLNTYSRDLQSIGIKCGRNREVFYREIDYLGEKLIENNEFNLAGITYSKLCKFARQEPRALEIFAKKGLAIAERTNDVIHMNSKALYIKDALKNIPGARGEYLRITHKVEKLLKLIIGNYEACVNNFQSQGRRPARKSDYKLLLAYIETELATNMKRKVPKTALQKLEYARKLLIDFNETEGLRYIEKLEREIKEQNYIALA